MEPHNFCVTTGQVHPPSVIVTRRTQNNGLQAGYQSRLRPAPNLNESLNDTPGQLRHFHRRHQPSVQPLPGWSEKKGFPKIDCPTLQRRSRYTVKTLQLLKRVAMIPPLAQCCDHKHRWRKINSAFQKQDRRRQYPAPTALRPATQTHPYCAGLFNIRGTSPSLPHICGVMQRPPAVGQHFKRTFSARSTSILCKKIKRDLRWRIAGDIITPAFWEQESLHRIGQETRGTPCFFPRLPCLNQTIFPSFFVAVLMRCFFST